MWAAFENILFHVLYLCHTGYYVYSTYIYIELRTFQVTRIFGDTALWDTLVDGHLAIECFG